MLLKHILQSSGKSHCTEAADCRWFTENWAGSSCCYERRQSMLDEHLLLLRSARNWCLISRLQLTRLLSSAWQMTSAPSLSEANFFEAGVLWQLKHFKSHKATGPDGISPKRLKIASHAVSPHITSLFRWSIHIETVYKSWKFARVSPIFKKDESIDLVRSKQAAWIWNK